MPWHCLVIAVVATLHALSVDAGVRPNFILILTDDQPYGYLGATGNPIVKTPNIDELANRGTLFTNAHVSSAICTPSRVSLLLSQYERKHGVNFNSGTSVSKEAWNNAYPMVMRRAGYYTGWVGKNHSPVGENGYNSGVMEKSFDYWYAGHGHLGFYPKEKHPVFRDAQSDTQIEVVGEGINDFLDNNQNRLQNAIRFLHQRPPTKPFILSVNFNLPHDVSTSTMQMRQSDSDIYRTMYRDIEIPLPISYRAKKDITEPKLPPDLLRAQDRQEGYSYVDTPAATRERYTRQLQAMTGIDLLVGRLRSKLEALNLDDNTVLIFTSDHGLFMGEYGLGGKGLCYEKTTHVPLIVFDPRTGGAGGRQKSDALVQNIDIAPMILAMAGIKSPAVFQGEDISPLLTAPGGTKRRFAFSENLWSTQFGNPRCEAVQSKEWKYIRYYRNNTFPASKKIQAARQLGVAVNSMLYAVHDSDMAVYRHYIESSLAGEPAVFEELYHLRQDPLEANNLIGVDTHRLVLEELRAAWRRSLVAARSVGAPMVNRYTLDSQLESNRGVQLE